MYPLLKRNWVNSSVKNSFKILHFNVLADQLTGDAGFIGTSAEFLKWDTRKELLFQVIAEQNPDILSLVECDHYEDFWVPRLAELGLISDSLVTKPAKTHGVTLFVRENRFKIITDIYLNDLVAMQGLYLYDLLADQKFLAVTTHLKAKKEYLVRTKQVNTIIDKILKFNVGEMNNSLLVMGDFNTDLSESSMIKLKYNLQIIPIPVKNWHPEGPYGFEWTTWKSREPNEWQLGAVVKKAIDHILISHNFMALRYLDLPAEQDVIDAGLLPGMAYPSDHLAICIELVNKDEVGCYAP